MTPYLVALMVIALILLVGMICDWKHRKDKQNVFTYNNSRCSVDLLPYLVLDRHPSTARTAGKREVGAVCDFNHRSDHFPGRSDSGIPLAPMRL